MADCAADVRAICAELGIDRLAMWGISGGGPHALACAALLPDLVVAAASLASAQSVLLTETIQPGDCFQIHLEMKLNGQMPPPQIDLNVHLIRKQDLGQPDVHALLFPTVRGPG